MMPKSIWKRRICWLIPAFVILISLMLEHLLLLAFRLAGQYFQHHGRRNILKDKSL